MEGDENGMHQYQKESEQSWRDNTLELDIIYCFKSKYREMPLDISLLDN